VRFKLDRVSEMTDSMRMNLTGDWKSMLYMIQSHSRDVDGPTTVLRRMSTEFYTIPGFTILRNRRGTLITKREIMQNAFVNSYELHILACLLCIFGLLPLVVNYPQVRLSLLVHRMIIILGFSRRRG
jgi:hypothetical protein